MFSQQLLLHLQFKNSDGSLSLGGLWFLAVGAAICVGVTVNFATHGPKALPDRRIRLFTNIVGLAVGVGFIGWVLLATPGTLY